MDELDHPDLHVAQSINPVPHIQRQLTRIEDARHPWNAALPLAQLYITLRSLGRLDGQFRKEWDGILGGDFLAWATHPEGRLDLEWVDVLAAKGALLDLMDRRGMVFRVQGPDPLQIEREDAERTLENMLRPPVDEDDAPDSWEAAEDE